MKYFCKSGVLLLCALSSAVVFSGCSRNVAIAPDSAPPSSPASESAAANTIEPGTAAQDTAQKPAASAAQIKWEANLDQALTRAKETQKPVMIDFYATWCGPCKLLDEQIYPTSEVVREAQNFVSVKIDVDKETEIARKYNVTGLPTIVFLDASGREVHRQSGIDGQVGSFVALLQTARARVAPTAA